MADFAVFSGNDFSTVSCLQHSVQMIQQGALRKIFAFKLASKRCCFEKFAILLYCFRYSMYLLRTISIFFIYYKKNRAYSNSVIGSKTIPEPA